MDSEGKRRGLVQAAKRWSTRNAPSKSAYKSKDNTPNPYFKGIFVSTDNSDEEKPPHIIYCPASTVKLVGSNRGPVHENISNQDRFGRACGAELSQKQEGGGYGEQH
jgi:hypothetical protein